MEGRPRGGVFDGPIRIAEPFELFLGRLVAESDMPVAVQISEHTERGVHQFRRGLTHSAAHSMPVAKAMSGRVLPEA